MAPGIGTILNPFEITDKIEAAIAAGQNVPAGLVYKFGANDWRKVPVDGSVLAKKMYLLPKGYDNTNGTAAKTVEVYGKDARFIGQADQAIVVGANCRASETTSHEQQLASQPDPTAPGATYDQAEAVSLRDAVLKTVCQYIGHHDEIPAVGEDPTDATDAEIDLVFQIKRVL